MQDIRLRAKIKVRDNAKRRFIQGGRAARTSFLLLGNALKWGLSALQGTCHLQSPL